MNSINTVSIRQADMHSAGSSNMVTNTTIAVYEDDLKEMYCTEMIYLLELLYSARVYNYVGCYS